MLTYPRFVRLPGYPGKPVISGLKSMLKMILIARSPLKMNWLRYKRNYAKLKKEFDQISLENRGHKLSMWNWRLMWAHSVTQASVSTPAKRQMPLLEPLCSTN